MNHGAFTFETVVDWVELEIQLAERSNFMAVQEALKKALRLPDNAKHPYVTALDETSSRAASIFRFRVHDPMRMGKLNKVLSELRERFNFGAIKVTAIEVAFDTYGQGAGVRQLAEIAADRYRFLTAPPGNKWYFYRDSGEGRPYIEALNYRELVKCFAEQWQLTDRDDKNADMRYHAYVKTRDDREPLPPPQYRARLEVTLQGAHWPCTTIEELEQFNFTKLAKHFNFRRLADGLHPGLRLALADWSAAQHGRSGSYRRAVRNRPGKYSGTRVFKRSTVADDELNEAVYQCLRKLTRDWRSQRAGADFPTHLKP